MISSNLGFATSRIRYGACAWITYSGMFNHSENFRPNCRPAFAKADLDPLAIRKLKRVGL